MLIKQYYLIVILKKTLRGGVNRLIKGVAISSFITTTLTAFPSSYAAEQTLQELKDTAVDKKITVSENTIVNGTGAYTGGEPGSNSLSGYTVNIENRANVVLNNIH